MFQLCSTFGTEPSEALSTVPPLTMEQTFCMDGELGPTLTVTGNKGELVTALDMTPQQRSCVRHIVFGPGLELGWHLMSGLPCLERVDLPEDVKYVPKHLVFNCSQLSSLVLPPTVEFISTEACYGCHKLVVPDLPETLTYIGARAFYKCILPPKLCIPGDCVVGFGAFQMCTGGKEVLFHASKEDPYGNKNDIQDRAFYGCKDVDTIQHTCVARGTVQLGLPCCAFVGNLCFAYTSVAKNGVWPLTNHAFLGDKVFHLADGHHEPLMP